MKMKWLIPVAASLCFASAASASVIYSNDFSRGDDTGWSGGSIVNEAYQQTTIDDTINFKLNDNDINDAVNLFFDVLSIGSWDSSGVLEDTFISIDRIRGARNITLYDGNLAANSSLSFEFQGISSFKDDTLRIRFKSDVTGKDELFAIDNVMVSSVPEPGVLALMSLGLLGIGISRKKKLSS